MTDNYNAYEREAMELWEQIKQTPATKHLRTKVFTGKLANRQKYSAIRIREIMSALIGFAVSDYYQAKLKTDRPGLVIPGTDVSEQEYGREVLKARKIWDRSKINEIRPDMTIQDLKNLALGSIRSAKIQTELGLLKSSKEIGITAKPSIQTSLAEAFGRTAPTTIISSGPKSSITEQKLESLLEQGVMTNTAIEMLDILRSTPKKDRALMESKLERTGMLEEFIIGMVSAAGGYSYKKYTASADSMEFMDEYAEAADEYVDNHIYTSGLSSDTIIRLRSAYMKDLGTENRSYIGGYGLRTIKLKPIKKRKRGIPGL